jgi:hypothetical protein
MNKFHDKFNHTTKFHALSKMMKHKQLAEGYAGEVQFVLGTSQGRIVYLKEDQKLYFSLYATILPSSHQKGTQ